MRDYRCTVAPNVGVRSGAMGVFIQTAEWPRAYPLVRATPMDPRRDARLRILRNRKAHSNVGSFHASLCEAHNRPGVPTGHLGRVPRVYALGIFIIVYCKDNHAHIRRLLAV